MNADRRESLVRDSILAFGRVWVAGERRVLSRLPGERAAAFTEWALAFDVRLFEVLGDVGGAWAAHPVRLDRGAARAWRALRAERAR